MKYKLFIDMDNTIADFNSNFVKYFSSEYGVVLDKDYPDYNILEQYKTIPKEVAFPVLFNREGFWNTMEPMVKAVDSLKQLSEHFDIIILTKPDNRTNLCVKEKLDWIRKHLPFIHPTNDVIFCADKNLLAKNGRILIDDNPEHLACTDWEETIVYAMPYNTLVPDSYRNNNWGEITNYLRGKYINVRKNGKAY